MSQSLSPSAKKRMDWFGDALSGASPDRLLTGSKVILGTRRADGVRSGCIQMRNFL